MWNKVAAEISAAINKNISAVSCETKWKTLKRTYKTITMHNKTSGQKRRHWEFYTVIHDIMFKKPEIEPIATCSSISGTINSMFEIKYQLSLICEEQNHNLMLTKSFCS